MGATQTTEAKSATKKHRRSSGAGLLVLRRVGVDALAVAVPRSVADKNGWEEGDLMAWKGDRLMKAHVEYDE